MSFHHPEALRAYLNRIGAEAVSFRRAIIKINRGPYYIEKAIIRINPDGTITAPKEYAPTEDETAKIKIALASITFPATTLATEANLETLLPKLKDNPYFIFYDRPSGNITMVQERRKNSKTGSRAYVPHCFIGSTGEWEVTEPDGGLPFFKPKTGDKHSKIMLHEGAKCAVAAQAIVDDPESTHPWRKSLLDYEHWGLIGGALAPQRSVWSELTSVQPSEVVYVCDRDNPGQSALQLVSPLYNGHIKGVKFGEAFPESFDIAEPIPQRFFSKGRKRYNGPSFESLKVPATFATELQQQDKGRPRAVIRTFFAEEWMHCVRPEVFIHRDWPNQILDREQFNNRVRPFSHVDDTAKLLLGCDASKAACLAYDPASDPGIYPTGANEFSINTHVKSQIEPEKGDPEPFLNYLEHLCPKKSDRHELIRWCATLACRPDIKMLYGVLLYSEEQGVGKSFLGSKILTPLVGAQNVSVPDETQMIESSFNYWLAHKRLAVVHEIYQGASFKAYNKLKSVITDDVVNVNRKFMHDYEVRNWIHIFACSNSARALKMDDEDRRWFFPEVTNKRQPQKYWDELVEWLNEEGGLEIVRWWLQDWLSKKENGGPVVVGNPAPDSELKRRVLREGLSASHETIVKLLEYSKNKNDPTIFFTDTLLRDYIKLSVYEGRHSEKLDKPAGLRRLAKNHGWFIGEVRGQVTDWGINTYGSYVIAQTKELAEMSPSDINRVLKLKPSNPSELMI